MTSPLPFSEAAERSLLGSILLEEPLYDSVAAVLTAEDFFLDSHRRIYSAMIELAVSGKPLDTITLAEQLARQKQLEPVGGISFLSELTTGVPRRSSVDSIIAIVREKSNLRRLITIANQISSDAQAQEETAENIVGKIHQSLYSIEGDSTQGKVKSAKEFMGKTLKEMEQQSKKDGLLGLSTGIHELDEATTGLRPGELWVVGALPGRGKTALGIQIAGSNAKAGVNTLVFELEMTDTQVGRRLLANHTNLGAQKIRNPNWIQGQAWNELTTGVGDIMDWPLWVDDASELNTRQLAARARLYVRKHNVKLIVVDYLMLVDEPEERETRLKARRIANTMRRIAKDEGISVVLLSQLSRSKDINDKPTMQSLRESGDIEAAAHVVVLLYMPLDSDGKPTGEDQMIIGKNREGYLGSIPVTYLKDKLRFEDRR